MILPVVALLAVAGSVSFSLLTKPSYAQARGYNIASLPTTIDLNDSTSGEIRNYYSNLNSLDNAEKTGTNLLKNLKPIIKNGQKYYSYDSNTKIWQMYEIIDRDWIKSPASSTTYGTYDAVNNKLIDYQYGTKDSVKNNPYIHALYNNRNIDNQARAWGNHNQDGWGINQEHIWAKSHGFDTAGSNSTGGARGDPMHLWAGNGWANHEHSNFFFANVDKTRTYKDAGTKYQTAYGNLTGYSSTIGGSETVFEPQDSDKGDIARAIFYMVARYNYYSGNDTDPIDGNNPNLVLLNNLSENGRTGTSSSTNPYGMGLLSDLLEWNKIDPVDEFEIHRNNLLYKNYTNNRNPFIDFPDWADLIWGEDKDVKYANPISDRINGVGLSVSVSSIRIEPEGSATATAYADNLTGNINWSIEDATVISLSKTSTDSGEAVTINALKEGSTKINLSAIVDGDESHAEINVRVKKHVNDIVVSQSEVKIEKGSEAKVSASSEGFDGVINWSVEDATIVELSKSTSTNGEEITIKGLKEGETRIHLTIDDEEVTAEIKVTISAKPFVFGLSPTYIIIIGVAVGVLVIGFLIFYFSKSSKAKRRINKKVKKAVRDSIAEYNKANAPKKKKK